ncbi:MAG: MFS transporter [Holosporales bacterium]|jgi:MFS family permease|nr:MFS transporter [Holosporales bacterium]
MKIFKIKAKIMPEILKDENKNRTVVWLCCICYFWGTASSMVLSLIPIYMFEKLGVDSQSFGLFVGVTTSFSVAARVFSGFLIDILKKKRMMLYIGTVLVLISKLILIFFTSVGFVLISKFIERIAQGCRRVATDTILADLTQEEGGFAFSFRHIMNLAGHATGSILTSLILILYNNNFKLIFISAIIPAIISLYTLEKKVKYEDVFENSKNNFKLGIRDAFKLPREYWQFMVIIALLMFNRFNEGFIAFRVRDIVGNSIWQFPLFMLCYEVFNIITALFIGKFVDKIDKQKIFIYSVLVLLGNDILSMFANNLVSVVLIYIFAGIHMGATNWMLLLIISRLSPKHAFGTAFAVYYGIESIAIFCSNYLAGGLSSNFAVSLGFPSSVGPFIQGAIASIALVICATKLRIWNSR